MGRGMGPKLMTGGVRVLEGGIVAWQEAGHPVIEGKAHISLERQVRIVAGALAGVGGALAVVGSPWFGLVLLFVGAGLVYAGLTDRCGMAMVLGKLKELATPLFVGSGSREEGNIVGNLKPSSQPPGRGTLVTRKHGQQRLQFAWTDHE